MKKSLPLIALLLQQATAWTQPIIGVTRASSSTAKTLSIDIKPSKPPTSAPMELAATTPSDVQISPSATASGLVQTLLRETFMKLEAPLKDESMLPTSIVAGTTHVAENTITTSKAQGMPSSSLRSALSTSDLSVSASSVASASAPNLSATPTLFDGTVFVTEIETRTVAPTVFDSTVYITETETRTVALDAYISILQEYSTDTIRHTYRLLDPSLGTSPQVKVLATVDGPHPSSLHSTSTGAFMSLETSQAPSSSRVGYPGRIVAASISQASPTATTMSSIKAASAGVPLMSLSAASGSSSPTAAEPVTTITKTIRTTFHYTLTSTITDIRRIKISGSSPPPTSATEHKDLCVPTPVPFASSGTPATGKFSSFPGPTQDLTYSSQTFQLPAPSEISSSTPQMGRGAVMTHSTPVPPDTLSTTPEMGRGEIITQAFPVPTLALESPSMYLHGEMNAIIPNHLDAKHPAQPDRHERREEHHESWADSESTSRAPTAAAVAAPSDGSAPLVERSMDSGWGETGGEKRPNRILSYFGGWWVGTYVICILLWTVIR